MADDVRRVTLRDVARKAGTTTMTVSNVLNHRRDQVGADTARRVLAASDALGYRPLAAARQLRAAKRMAIGVVIVDPSPYYLSDPFTAAMLAGLNEALARAGYSLILRGVPAPALGDVPMLRHVECDGMCLVASGPAKERKRILARVASLSVPVVVIQDDGAPGDVCSVMLDDTGGADAIARHLALAPPRSVAMLVPRVEWPAMVRREAAVRKIFPGVAVLRCADEGFEATQATLAAYLDAHGVPDALIAGNDRMALAALGLFAARGISVPERVRVTGFNGLESHHYAAPRLTTVFSPAFHLGETAADALVRRLAGGSFEFRRRVLPVRFAAELSSQPVPQQGDRK
jgi:LacI family transcriptional regulator